MYSYSQSESRARIERIKAMMNDPLWLEEFSDNSKQGASENHGIVPEMQPSSLVQDTRYSRSKEVDMPRSKGRVKAERWADKSVSKTVDAASRRIASAYDHKETHKGPLSRLSSSLSCIACVAGDPRETRDDTEECWAPEEIRHFEHVPAELDAPAKKTKMKKVAFLSDLVDYNTDMVPHISNYSLEPEESFDDPTATESLLREPASARAVRVKSNPETGPLNPANVDMSRRMKTNMLVILEQINEDAGLWTGLRHDSFD